ncbi:UNVERIFIED_CONTAM: hypothetical protein Slati_3309900 [Sesamum latifolium]|uniref:Nuclear pore complex protein n=1 Tax=Sesamum latifolium TaxID=2727402 RepID=A0AAW2V0V7_9LAMI
MATTATTNATDQSSNSTRTVDASLWWEPFNAFLTDLESASGSSDLPQSLEKKLKDNHTWFLDTILQFKSPNQRSREALDSPRVKIGPHELNVQPELKDAALKISSIMCLDEVQSYILVKRSMERNDAAASDIHPDILNLVVLEYHIERQCLLKCTRQILMHALYFGSQSEEGSAVLEEAQRLISDGLECKLLSIFQDLLSSNYPDQMDIDLYTLWAEETLIEDNLILDILFLVYYESYCTCDAKCWKRLCTLYQGIVNGLYNFQKLAISTEAIRSIYHAKVQLLFILIEALNLENLLQMIHDNTPFRQGTIAFSDVDVQQMDALVSSFNVFEAKEAGPLILAWAVFLCLISSLPGKEENNLLMEIDHIGYVRQAFEASSLGYFLEILQSDTLKDSDVSPVAGYRSVLRTFISAFIASYEISLQFGDDNLKLILEILCKIYRGEESLCIQFWDRDSFIDGPVRCLLCNLEGEFPFQTIELVSLLSALSEGAWPSECVFNFLDKSVGLSTPLEISNDSVVPKIVETRYPLQVAGIGGLIIPSNSRGQVMRMIDKKYALVRWEYTESGVLVLLLRLAQQQYTQNTEELIVILDLLSRLVTFNVAVCYSLMDAWNSFHDEETGIGIQEKYVRIDVVEIICALVKNLPPNVNGAAMMSMGVTILTKMLRCLPSYVATMALKGNIFDVAFRTNPFDVDPNSLSSGSWLLSGRLAKMLLIDCEQSDCSLTLSGMLFDLATYFVVLDFTMNLLETGLETDTVLALIVFSLQYVLVNHEIWKYKVKYARWKVTLKVLEVMKKCIWSISSCQKTGEVVRDIMLSDSSIHSALFRIVCTTTPSLEVNRCAYSLHILRYFYPTCDSLVILFDLSSSFPPTSFLSSTNRNFMCLAYSTCWTLRGLHQAISSGLDVLISMVYAFSKDSPSLPVFDQAVLSPMTKPIPVISAAISLMSYFRDPKIQIGAARLLSVLFIADISQSYTYSNANLCLDDKQLANFRKSICNILCEQSPWNEDLILATLKLLTSVARNQPAFLTAIIVSEEYLNAQVPNMDSKHQPHKTENGSLDSKEETVLHAILQYIRSKMNVLLCLLSFLRALWQGAPQFTKILEQLKVSDKFWRHLTNSVRLISQVDLSGKLTEKELQNLAYKYQYLSNVLDILGYEIFLQKKLMHAEVDLKRVSKSPTNGTEETDASPFAKDGGVGSLKEIISTWCKSSILSDLIKACVSWEYGNSSHLRAKVAFGLFAVHAMVKLRNGDRGSLSLSLIERIITLSQKLLELPAFSELLTRYKERGYSGGQELENLILSDLFYHIQGELEGRQIDNRPFKELLQFLLDSRFLDAYIHIRQEDLFADINSVYLYDTARLGADLGLEMWELSAWKESKEVAETMLLSLQEANSRMLHSNSKLSALRGLITLLYMQEDNVSENEASIGLKISEQVVSSCIDNICQCLHATLESLTPIPNSNEDVFDILTAQAELLLLLVRSKSNSIPTPACVLILKTSGYGLKVFRSCRPSVAIGTATRFMLMLILSSVELIHKDLHSGSGTGIGCLEGSAEVSNSSLGLLPVLCDCIEHTDHCALSLSGINLILKGFSTPATWFPIIREHLRLQHIIKNLQDVTLSKTVSVILKFLLNLARVRQGAEMLLNAGILVALKMLLSDLPDGGHFSVIQSERIFSSTSDKTEKSEPIWGLSLAVLTAIIQSLGDSSAASIVDYVMACILVEKARVISYYLSAPDFPTDGHETKRARALKSNISLSELKETQNTLALICVLARYWNSWKKVLQNMESQLREKSIHLLAFISRATQRPGESPKRDAPLLCHPVLKDEFEWYKKQPFINSRNGWFALSALGCKLNPKFASLSSRTTALVLRDQSNDNADTSPQTHLSDLIAIEIYKIAFLLLKFLCMQAESAARKAEEVGFVDVAHFPELPMPDILHGLQDQGIAIITELCEANKMKQLAPEIQEVCLLLLQITVMALYLEFCVIQICGIRPVLGHVETFSKEFRLLVRATEGHLFLKEPLRNLKQIVSFVYPELIQAEGLF